VKYGKARTAGHFSHEPMMTRTIAFFTPGEHRTGSSWPPSKVSLDYCWISRGGYRAKAGLACYR